jgi:hypothetical protein
MPTTFSAAVAELTELRNSLDILQADGHETGVRAIAKAIDKLEAQLGINQVRY